MEDIIANDNEDFIADSVLCNECIELYRSIEVYEYRSIKVYEYRTIEVFNYL